MIGGAAQADPPVQAEVIDFGEAEEAPTMRIVGQRADEAAPTAVIDRATLEEDALADLPEVLDEQPGLRVTRLGGLGAFSALSIRGSTTEQVAVFLDGIPLSSGAGGPVDPGSLPLGPIESIVVHRGVAPVQYGESAIGGVVQINTRPPTTERFELELGAGQWGTRSARWLAGGGDDRGGWVMGVDAITSEGDFTFTDDQGTVATGGDDRTRRRQNNAFRQVAALGRGQITPSRGLTISAVQLITTRQNGLPGLGQTPTERAATERLRTVSGLSIEARATEGQVRPRGRVVPWLVYARARLRDPLAELGLTADDTDDRSLAAGLLGDGALPLPLTEAMVLTPRVVLTGRHERFDPSATEGSPTSGPSARRLRLSGAGQLHLALDPLDLELLGSLRREQANSEIDEATVDQGAFSHRLALSFTGLPATRLSANLARSVRFPTLFELFGNTGFVQGNAGLQPETGDTLDLGLIHTLDAWLPVEAWSIEARVFQTTYADLIQFERNGQGVLVARNVDRAEITGLELGTAGQLGPVRLRGSLTGLDTENTGPVRARRGKPLPLRPRWQAFGRVEIRLPTKSITFTPSAEVEHLSGNQLDLAGLVTLPERRLWGAGLTMEWADGAWRASLKARNLADAQVLDLAGYPLPGRTVMAALRWTPPHPEGAP